MRRSSLLILLVIAFVSAGCKKSDTKAVGHYNGKLGMTPQMEQQGAAKDAKLVDALKKGSATLDLKADNTYSMSFVFSGRTTSQSGTWEAGGDKITLTPTGNARKLILTVAADGSTLSSHDSFLSLTFSKG